MQRQCDHPVSSLRPYITFDCSSVTTSPDGRGPPGRSRGRDSRVVAGGVPHGRGSRRWRCLLLLDVGWLAVGHCCGRLLVFDLGGANSHWLRIGRWLHVGLLVVHHWRGRRRGRRSNLSGVGRLAGVSFGCNRRNRGGCWRLHCRRLYGGWRSCGGLGGNCRGRGRSRHDFTSFNCRLGGRSLRGDCGSRCGASTDSGLGILGKRRRSNEQRQSGDRDHLIHGMSLRVGCQLCSGPDRAMTRGMPC